MKTLAITGSSGSGKTTISKLFLRMEGTCILNADEIAREMVENDSKYVDEIALYFGSYILENSKKINRNKLSNIIENDNFARKNLNQITMKYFMPRLDKFINDNSDKKIVIIDVPILFENGLENYFDKILCVISEREEQINRIRNRDNIDESKANSRLNMQLENEFYINNSNYVIYNYGKSIDELYKEVFKIYFDIIKNI